MLINADEINNALKISDNVVTIRGKKYFEQDRVKISDFKYISDDEYIAYDFVSGTYNYFVEVNKKDGNLSYNCNCPAHALSTNKPCKHIIAMIFDLYVNENTYLNFKKEEDILGEKFSNIPLVNHKYVEKEETDDIITYYERLKMPKNLNFEKIKIIPKLNLNYKDLEVSFKIGTSKMYILKDIYDFGRAMIDGTKLKYGKELEFSGNISIIEEESKIIASYISKKTLEYEEYSKLGNYSFNIERKYKSIFKLKYSILDDFFNIIKENYGVIEIEDYLKEYSNIKFVEQNPIFDIEVIDEKENGLTINHVYENYYIFEGQEYSYILYKDKLHKCSKEYSSNTLPFLKEFSKKRKENINISIKNATSFCEYVIPNLKQNLNVILDENILEKYRAEKLGTKIYLDIDKNNNIVALVKFCYGELEFNPFDENDNKNCNRNIIEETFVKELFKEYNFNINSKNKDIYLNNEEHIYNFLKDGINVFMEKFEVLVTDKLKNKQIINPKSVSMGVRIENDLLQVDFSNLDFSEKEVSEIFNTYRLKKKYYRLKDGSFINLESSGIDTLVNLVDNLGINEKEIVKGTLELPKYRSIYLDSLVKKDNDIIISKDSSFKQIIKDITEVSNSDFVLPEHMQNILRSYQKTGFNWLKTLEKYGFGGILADDMGLGKTLQVITLFLDEKENEGKTSIVVCPSSLYINWQKEIAKFSPNINTLVVSGSAEDREKLIEKASDYDVIITSYDLLKRDIEKYEKVKFKYAIADEAQYIKNNNTKNAKALKKIKSKIRFALTGTPMENSLSELWSIFDFVMPGYLFSYKKFKQEFETAIIKDDDKDSMSRLQTLVAPFILRRIKKEVLKELPDKTETIMYSEMTKEQDKLYKAYMSKAKSEMSTEIQQKGFENSQIKILALITRLRQLCCHPSLFIDNYEAESSKLNQCIELIEGAIDAGHKILLFSQFTSMLDIIRKELENKNIKYCILTGQTKVDTRIEMVETFNKSKEISVFLISLKAGGTGLNLTGADMVIHYDPWWNISAQNQATDRAHRIGQRSNVQVFKLITQNSIEEKIKKLQDKKSDLTNSIIKEGETFINKMSKEDILDLFEN